MKLRYLFMVLMVLFIVGCAPEYTVEDTTPDAEDIEAVEEQIEDIVEEDPVPDAPQEVVISVTTRAYDETDEDVISIRPLELEEGYKFSGKNCFICGEQLFELVEIISEEEVVVMYDDVLEPLGTTVEGENQVTLGVGGACFRAETLSLGVDICLELVR